jgi:shikimate kinase
MNLVLIGYRGTGKSTIGKLIAEDLSLEYLCLDAEIVARAGKSIPEIVDQHSWEYFRELEEQVVKDCAARDGQVLDTGGGVITRSSNVARLKQNGIVFLLEATVEDIVDRIGNEKDRPSLTGAKSFTDEVSEVLEERKRLYRDAALYTVNTSELSAVEAAEKIVALFSGAEGHR